MALCHRLLIALAVLPLLSGCNNLWEWTAGADGYDALLADGKAALRDGDYDLAVQKLGDAVAVEPSRGEARYYYAKAAVLQSGIDVVEIVQAIIDADENGGAAEIFAFETPLADRVYRVNRTVIDALLPIHDGAADAVGLGSSDVGLDLAVAHTLRGILRLRDTNGDGTIDALDLTVSEFSLEEGGGYSLEGIDNLPPDDLNAMLDDLNALLTSGGDLASGTGGVIDPEELDELVDSLGGDLSAFYVNTGAPGNPGEGDNDGDGATDEECLNDLDDDGDGRVDEDATVFCA
ncbi:MAG: hypothetical protein ACT4PE_00985 [Candidatus Eiseniibacteriota bacterium]